MLSPQSALPSTKPRIGGLETLRGAAATAVVLYHVTRHVGHEIPLPYFSRITQCGHAGVDLFFVLSGFIILFVHEKDLGQPSRWSHYAWRRFNRVFPTYWVALFVTIMMIWAGHHRAPSFGRIVWSAMLLPSWTEPLLGVAWTLQYEIVFYAMFSIAILNWRLGLAAFLAWLAIILLTWTGALTVMSSVPPSLSDPANIAFFLGMTAAAWLRHRKHNVPVFCMAAGLTFLVAAGLAENAGLMNGYQPAARLVYGVPSALLITGVVSLEQAGRIHIAAWAQRLGAASYSIYLFQFVFIGLIWQTLRGAGLIEPELAPAILAVLAAGAVFGGLAASELIEQPMLKRGGFYLFLRSAKSSVFRA